MLELDEILERCRRGDDLAWEALVRRYQSRVYAVALHYLRDPAEARDLAQEAFIRVYQRMATLQGHETFLPWLLRVTRNVCIDHIRRRKVRPPAVDVPVEDGLELADQGLTPDQSWDRRDRKRLVYKALEKMNEQDREIILLKEIQGLELKEVAEMLGIPVGTVKSRSHRARIHLAQVILSLNPAYGTGSA